MTHRALRLLSLCITLCLGFEAYAQEVSSDEARIQKLRTEIQRHDRLYHELGTPEIHDRDYDALQDELRRLSDAADRPPPPGPMDTGKTRHHHPMTGLPKAYDLETLFRKITELPRRGAQRWSIEPKYDGIAVKLVYEDGRFIHAMTRGDGILGTVIRHPPPVPHRINFPVNGIVEFSGELYVRDADFDAENEARKQRGQTPFAHPRGMAHGIVNSHEPQPDSRARLSLVIFRRQDGRAAEKNDRTAELNQIREQGFATPEPIRHVDNIETLRREIIRAETERYRRGFETDGVVIHTESDSETCTAPIAYKFAANAVRSRLIGVEYTVGRTGKLTPVARLEPVTVSGAVVERATLHSLGHLESLRLQPGDRILVERTGGTTPKFRPVVIRDDRAEYLTFPAACPSCGVTLNRAGAEPRCDHPDCEQRLVAVLHHALSRDALNITGIGPALLTRLVSTRHLRTLDDLYGLDFERIEKIPDLSATERAKFRTIPEAIRQSSFSNRLVSFGIEGLGKTQATVVAARYTGEKQLMEADDASIRRLPIGSVAKRGLLRFRASDSGRKMLMRTAGEAVEPGAKKSVARTGDGLKRETQDSAPEGP